MEDVQLDPNQIPALLNSDVGRLVGAGVLFLLFLLFKQSPGLMAWLDTPWKKRIAAIALAFVPVLIMALTKEATVSKAVFSAIFVFTTSMAIHHSTDKPKPDSVISPTPQVDVPPPPPDLPTAA